MKRKTLEDRAFAAMKRPHRKFVKSHQREDEFTNGYTWGFTAGWLSGYRSAKREQRRGK